MAQKDVTSLDEALELSGPQGVALDLLDDDDDEDVGDDESEDYGDLPDAPPYGDYADDEDEDLADLNNPDVQTLSEAPLLGASSPRSEMFGESAETFGRATSPKLYAQAANFPTAVQYRVWRWENGIPVGLGAIDCEATEEDMVRKFYAAMPQAGDGKFQFRFRPVDIRGKELGKEFTLNFSEHHSEVTRIRDQKAREREDRMGSGGGSEPILINQGGGDGGAYAEEMGRMFEQAVESAERRSDVLQTTLEEERNRLREEEKSRYQERIALADRSTDVVQKMTDRLMETDRARSQEQLAAQNNQSDMLLKTLTTVFSQQQSAASAQGERLRQTDEVRMKQDREFFDRQRMEAEGKRQQDREEYEQRMSRSREDADRRSEAQKIEGSQKIETERARLELEAKRIEEHRKFELEALRVDSEKRDREAERRRDADREEVRRREDALRAEAERKEKELERRREVEKGEMNLRLEREKMELERARVSAREERERWRTELEEKRRSEREDWERKRSQEKEDAERRAQADRERVERERQDFQLRMERERQEREDAANRRAEQARQDEERRKDEAQRAEESRKSETELKLRQMDVDSQRAREHQEKMSEQSRLDREARDAAQTRRDSLEREAREASNQDRTRQHDMAMRQMELEREQGREHQERLLQIQKIQNGGGITSLVESLGMETPEILGRIFGGGDGEGGSWSEAIPKVLGSIAELGAAAMKAKGDQPQVQQRGRRQLPAGARVVQTPQGPQVIMPGSVTGIPMPTSPPEPDLPTDSSVPPEFKGVQFAEEEVSSEAQVEADSPPEPDPVGPLTPVDTLARAKAAGMTLQAQKKARKAIRTLSGKLEVSANSEWLGLITEAITDEVGIYYYIKAVTVRAALEEAQPNEVELHDRIITALRESGLIPDGVPYEEADIAAQKEEP